MKSYRTMCKKTWAVILAIACHLPATWATNANEIELIPKPVHVEQTSGNFRLSPNPRSVTMSLFKDKLNTYNKCSVNPPAGT